MTYRCGDVVWAMYHHRGRCCSMNSLAIHFRSGVRAFMLTCSNLYIVYAWLCWQHLRGVLLVVVWKTKISYILYIYVQLLCCCYACAILWVCCCHVADMLLLCCCYAAAMPLLCTWYVVLFCCYAVAVLMLCCCAVVACR